MTRRYSAYKASGVEWLGEVPEGWKLGKFRHLFKESAEKIEAEVVGVMLSVSGYRGIEIKEYDDENRKRTDEDLEGYRIVRPGQLVVNTMWLNYAGLGVSAHEGHVSPAYRSYDFRGGLELRYAHHLLRSSIYVTGYTQLLTGVRPNSLQMSRNDLMDFPVLVPPLPEQRAIAGFLDRETAKIDALVAEQRHLIDLLREKRQAVISHAVIKGLNPKAPLKPSGIDWLGDVPEGWEVRKLSKLFSARKGPRGQQLTKEYCGAHSGDFPVYSGQTEDFGVMGAIDDFDFDTGHEGVIFSTTVGAKAMSVSHIFDRFSLLQNCMIIQSKDSRALTRFFFYQLQPLFAYFRRQIPEHMQASFRIGDLYAFQIVIPSKNEQFEIAAYLDAVTAKLDALTATAETAITLLQERRAALNSAAVTGKIDVRSDAPTETEAA